MEGHVIGQQNLNDSPGERGLRLSNKEGKERVFRGHEFVPHGLKQPFYPFDQSLTQCVTFFFLTFTNCETPCFKKSECSACLEKLEASALHDTLSAKGSSWLESCSVAGCLL